MDQRTYEIAETKDVLIPLPDGVHLAADLILPVGGPPAPAIVVYQPYLKALSGRGAILAWQRHFARRGYACLTVDMRGTGGSDGVMPPCFAATEREDAVAMLAWIAAQPWCDGTTGMWGISYSGSTALAAASLRPPSLKAIIPLHGTANEFWGFLNPHGCRPAWWTDASWGPWMVLQSLLPPLSRDADRRWARVWRERLESLEPVPFAWHRTPYDTYMAWRTDASRVQAALYAISGWHDYYPQATFDYFNAAGGPKRILIGEWKHEFPDLAVRGGVDHLADMDRWWDRFLRGVDNGIDREPAVHVWHQGAGRWRTEEAWPPRHSAMTDWHAGPGGRLAPEAPAARGESVYDVDPTVGAELLPWDPQTPVVPMPADRSADDHRSLAFDGPPQERPLDLVGSPEAVVTLASTEPDFPLHVALCDVRPDGHSTLICQGWVRTGRTPSGALRSGEPATLTVPLYATSYRLAAGHRLRMVIAGADFPLLWPAARNPRLTVFHGPSGGTRVRLPIGRIAEAEPPSPGLGAPHPPEAGAKLLQSWHNRTTRDLNGATATFEQVQESSQPLDDGSVVHVRQHNRSTVVAARPEDTVLTARMEARVERDGDPLFALVESVQTQDTFHIEATIELAGRPFYRRAWDLPLGSR